MAKSKTVLSVFAAFWLFSFVSFHVIVGIAFFPLVMMQYTPDSPIAALALFIVRKSGWMGFVFFYWLPLTLISGWSVYRVSDLIGSKKRNSESKVR